MQSSDDGGSSPELQPSPKRVARTQEDETRTFRLKRIRPWNSQQEEEVYSLFVSLLQFVWGGRIRLIPEELMDAVNATHLVVGLSVLWDYARSVHELESALDCLNEAVSLDVAACNVLARGHVSLVAPASALTLAQDLTEFELHALLAFAREWRAAERVLVPISDMTDEGMVHWSLLILEPRRNRFCYRDSMMREGLRASKQAKKVQAAMEAIAGLAAGVPFEPERNCLQQQNGHDCGPIVSAWLDELCTGAAPITAEGISAQRTRLAAIAREHAKRDAHVPAKEADEVARNEGWTSIAVMNCFVDQLKATLDQRVRDSPRPQSECDDDDDEAYEPNESCATVAVAPRFSARLEVAARAEPPAQEKREAQRLKLRRAAALIVQQGVLPIPEHELSPDFGWRPCQPGYPGCVLFSYHRRARNVGSLPCAGCSDVHPRDWSYVGVIDRVWRFHCFPTLAVAITGSDPYRTITLGDGRTAKVLDEFCVKKSGFLKEDVTLSGFDAVPRGSYRWADVLHEEDEFADAMAAFEILTFKGRTFYIDPSKHESKPKLACNFALLPIRRAAGHWVVEVRKFSAERNDELLGTVVLPCAVMTSYKLALEFLEAQLGGGASGGTLLAWEVSATRIGPVWQALKQSLDASARNTPLVDVTPKVGWVHPMCYVMRNDFQIVHEVFLGASKGAEGATRPDWHERVSRTRPFAAADKWRIATAYETDIWVMTDGRNSGPRRKAPQPHPPPLKHPALWRHWRAPTDDGDRCLQHLRELHRYVRDSWRTDACQEGQNYPQFLLTQAYGLMVSQRKQISTGERHFPWLLAWGARRRGKTAASQTMMASYVPYQVLDCPLILGGRTTIEDARTLLGYIQNVPLVLDDTDNIKREKLAALIQECATGRADASGADSPSGGIVNLNPEKVPRLNGPVARRLLQLLYGGDDLALPHDFDTRLAAFWDPLFGLVVLFAHIHYDSGKVEALMETPWWRTLLWPHILKQFPDADERDHVVWLYFTLKYGELILYDSKYAVMLFARAFQLLLVLEPCAAPVPQDPIALVCACASAQQEALAAAVPAQQPKVAMPEVTQFDADPELVSASWNGAAVKLHLCCFGGRRFWVVAEVKRTCSALASELDDFSRRAREGRSRLKYGASVVKDSTAWNHLKAIAPSKSRLLIDADDPALIALGLRPPANNNNAIH